MAHGVLTRVKHGAGMLIGAAGSAGCDMEPRGEAKMSARLRDGCGGAAHSSVTTTQFLRS